MADENRVPNRFVRAITVAEGEQPTIAEKAHTGTSVSIRRSTAGARGTLSTEAGHISIEAVSTGTSVALPRDDGMQILSELREGETRAEFDMTLPAGVTAVATETGGFDLVAGEDGDPRLVVARVEAPWAVDARGNLLETRYRLSGERIQQYVNTDGAAFPVIADPRLTYGWGVYLNLTGVEVKAAAALSYGSGAVASILACNFAKLPTPLSKVVKVLCTVLGGASVLSMMRTLSAISKNTKKVTNSGCYQIKLVPRGNSLKKVSMKGNCIP